MQGTLEVDYNVVHPLSGDNSTFLGVKNMNLPKTFQETCVGRVTKATV